MRDTISKEQLIERLNWRYATKQFDPTRKIAPADWAALEETLVLSPSSGGLQPWTFFVITDPVTREKLLPATFGQVQIRDASHLVVFTVKTRFGEAEVDEHIAHTAAIRGLPVESLAPFRAMLVDGIVNALDQPSRQAWATRQAYIALGTLLSSAALLGIDACPMEGFLPAQYDEVLGLPEKGLAAAVICALGYRAETDPYANLPKVRFPKERVLQHI